MPDNPSSSSARNSNHAHMQPQPQQQAWTERFKRIFHRDRKLHVPSPFCLFECCPCHEDHDLKQKLIDSMIAGLLTNDEMNRAFLGRTL